MNLEQVLVGYARENLSIKNDWYRWRKINPNLLPLGIRLNAESQYSQNVELKQKLFELYLSGNDDTKIEVTNYYIAVWGGVRRNKLDKMKFYAFASPLDLMAQGVSGVASWSKALSIRNPSKYAIYDARVALSLNCLQIQEQVDIPKLFPLLKGQNKRINAGSNFVLEYSKLNSWQKIDASEFYDQYISVLSNVAVSLKVEIYVLEMLLFSHAPVFYTAVIEDKNL